MTRAETPTDVGRRIQKLRDARGFTQRALAARVRVAPSTVAAWEGGAQLPAGANLVNLARELGTTERAIIEGSDLDPAAGVSLDYEDSYAYRVIREERPAASDEWDWVLRVYSRLTKERRPLNDFRAADPWRDVTVQIAEGEPRE